MLELVLRFSTGLNSRDHLPHKRKNILIAVHFLTLYRMLLDANAAAAELTLI